MIGRVLLVDDGRLDNIFHAIVLRKSGVVGEVDAIESAEEALEWLADPANPQPDLIIVDLSMPAMRGPHFAERVTELRLSSARIVMLTASSADEDRAEARDVPAIVDFLTKPLTVDDVRRIDREWFADRTGRGDVSGAPEDRGGD